MYLSVPLPRALEKVVDVVFIAAAEAKAPRTQRHRLVLQLHDQVSKMRQLLLKVLQLEESQHSQQLVLAEVANHNVARILEDQLLLRYLKDEHRTVYAFLVPPPPPSLTPTYHAETSSYPLVSSYCCIMSIRAVFSQNFGVLRSNLSQIWSYNVKILVFRSNLVLQRKHFGF